MYPNVANISETLAKIGYLYIPKVPVQSLEEILDMLGRVIFVTDVKVKPESKALVTSAKALRFHTDHSRAKYILWYCIEQCSQGGETLLLDANEVFEQLEIEHQNSLARIHLYEHKVFEDDPESHPLILYQNGKRLFYYSFWLLNEEDKNNPALIAFEQAIQKANPVRFKLQPSDVLVIDNQRILHARTQIGGDRKRWLKRYWIS
ncbi:MAG: TauD/TfdA family dioxygenase [Bacteroidia bacterium]|nr:TauD/TfdA family dioxygenase [Bacteroidia bacterium]MDW8301362.1 TauD/TfdA family dioxygenase [Bacteroidia bacterium]